MQSDNQLCNSQLIIQGNSLLAGRFEVLRVLGAGSSSRVCLVRDLHNDGRHVALKILTNTTIFEESTVERFIREFEVCRSIRHPNLVETYELIRTPKLIAFSIEYVPGEDLAKIIDSRRLSLPEIENLMKQLLEALEELHSHQIVHRDIKPENIIVCEDGTLKLVDLGIVKCLDRAGLTKAGLVLGTAQYLAPESIREGLHDERSDLYAAGMVLFEMLSGKRRLFGKRDSEVFQILERSDFTLPAFALEGIPAQYRSMVKRALQASPGRRFQSAREMIAAFHNDSTDSAPLEGSMELQPLLDLSDFARDLEQASHQRHLSRFSLALWSLVAFIGFAVGAWLANIFSAAL